MFHVWPTKFWAQGMGQCLLEIVLSSVEIYIENRFENENIHGGASKSKQENMRAFCCYSKIISKVQLTVETQAPIWMFALSIGPELYLDYFLVAPRVQSARKRF